MKNYQYNQIPILVFIGAISVIIVFIFSGFEVLLNPEKLLPRSAFSIVGVLPCLVFFGSIGVIYCSFKKAPRNRFLIFNLAFYVRVILGIFLTFYLQYDDERVIHEVAKNAIYFLRIGEPTGLDGYLQVVVFLYQWFGVNLLVPKVFNALIGSLLPFLLYDLALAVFPNNKAIARRVLYFAAFLPPLVIYGSVNLKEETTAFAIVLTFWFLQVPFRNRLWRTFWGFAGVILVYYLRRGWFVFPLLGLIVSTTCGKYWQIKQIISIKKIAIAIIIVVIIAVFMRPFIQSGWEYVLWKLNSPYSEQTFQTTAQGATYGQFLTTQNPFSPSNLVVFVLRGLFSPSPFRFVFDQGIHLFFEGLIMLTWYILVPLGAAGAIAYYRSGFVISWTVTATAIFCVAAVAAALGGDPYRHRIAMIPLLYLLAGAGTEHINRYRFITWCWYGAALLFTFTYFWLRR